MLAKGTKLRHKLPLPVLGTHEIIKIKPEYIYNIQFDLLVVDLRSAPDAEKNSSSRLYKLVSWH